MGSTDPGEIMLMGHDVEMTGDVITDGRQIYYTPTSGGKPTLYGGPLSSTKSYVFDHLEFKFGTDATTGSEHKLDGKQYAMEVQLVFYDQSAHIDAATAGASTTAVADGFAKEIAGKTLKLKDLLGDIDSVKDYYY